MKFISYIIHCYNSFFIHLLFSYSQGQLITNKIMIYFHRFTKLRWEEQTVFYSSGDYLFLVDLQSCSGFLRCVIYPPFRDICLIVWEILYILAMAIFTPFKCIYRLLIEIVIYELYDFFIAVCYMPLNIGKILLSLPIYLFDGVKTFLLENSWADLLLRAIHISLIVLFLIFSSQTSILQQFENIERKLRAHFRNVAERYKRRLKQS